MPHYLIEYSDTGDLEAREQNRAAHIEFRRGFGDKMLLAGPLLDRDGSSIGSLILVEADDQAAAEGLAASDPLVGASVLELISVRPYRVAALLGKPFQAK